MRRVLFVLLLTGCNAPTIGVAAVDGAADTTADGGLDAGPEVRTCPSVRSPFETGAICSGHDEDDDCTPDECDDCPNVIQDTPLTGRDPIRGGESCAFGAEPIRNRLLFDNFETADPRWRDPWKHFYADERLSLAGGSARIGNIGSERIAWIEAGAGARDVIATAVVRITDRSGGGFAGLSLRTATTTPTTAYLCVLDGGLLMVAAQACTSSGSCEMKMIREGTTDLRKPLDGDWSQRVLMRGVARNTATGVRVDCQAFPVPRTVTDVAATLRTIDASKNTVGAELKSIVLKDGEVGVVAHFARIEVESLDVLVGE